MSMVHRVTPGGMRRLEREVRFIDLLELPIAKASAGVCRCAEVSLMKQTSTLSTRQHGRDEIDLAVELIVAEEHRTQVTFSAASAAGSAHAVRGRARDISSGGVGIACSVFLPRMCEGLLRVFSDEPGSEVLLEQRVKVRRVYMTGRDGGYAIGLAFVAPGADLPGRIERLRAACGSSKASKSADAAEAGEGGDG